MSISAEALLVGAPDASSRVCLLATSSKESGAWLNALPISSLGLKMDNDTFRIAVGLRLGSSLCRTHTCCHCGAEVDSLATHGLSCRWIEGRHFRHAALNDIIHQALSSAKIPSRLEPSGVYRADGKRPDGISVVPWKNGKLLAWDVTCTDTFAPSYIASATSNAGAVAALAEERKLFCMATWYQAISLRHLSHRWVLSLVCFLKELGHRIKLSTGEARTTAFLLQCLSVAVQRGYAASVLGRQHPLV